MKHLIAAVAIFLLPAGVRAQSSLIYDNPEMVWLLEAKPMADKNGKALHAIKDHERMEWEQDNTIREENLYLEENLAILKGEERVFCFYDIEGAKYEKQFLNEARDEFYDDRIRESLDEICSNFTKGACESGPRSFNFSWKRMSRYVLKIYVTEVDDDGETVAYAMLFDTEKKKQIFQKQYKGDGGMFGTLCNLMGDAAERMGKKVGRDFKRVLR